MAPRARLSAVLLFGLCGALTVCAGASDFHHRQFRREPRSARSLVETLRQRCSRNFAHRSAGLANQKRHNRRLIVIMSAGQKRVTAFDAVDQTVVHQKIQRAVDGNRRRTRHCLGKFVDHFIGTERPMARQQRTQNLPPDRRELLTPALADLFGMQKGVLGAAAVVMIWGRENRLRLFHSVNM